MSGGYSKGKAFVEYLDHATAKKALEGTNEQELDGRTLHVDFSGGAPGGGAARGGAGNGEVTTLFVGNMSFRTEDWALKEFFSSCGNVKDVRIAMGEDGRPRGFAHVEFETNADAVKAMSLAG